MKGTKIIVRKRKHYILFIWGSRTNEGDGNAISALHVVCLVNVCPVILCEREKETVLQGRFSSTTYLLVATGS